MCETNVVAYKAVHEQQGVHATEITMKLSKQPSAFAVYTICIIMHSGNILTCRLKCVFYNYLQIHVYQ